MPVYELHAEWHLLWTTALRHTHLLAISLVQVMANCGAGDIHLTAYVLPFVAVTRFKYTGIIPTIIEWDCCSLWLNAGEVHFPFGYSTHRSNAASVPFVIIWNMYDEMWYRVSFEIQTALTHFHTLCAENPWLHKAFIIKLLSGKGRILFLIVNVLWCSVFWHCVRLLMDTEVRAKHIASSIRTEDASLLNMW
jgi:hypothetical protein